VVQERDGLGDNLPSDYLIRVQQGGFYGWPYAYIGKHPQPGFASLAPDKVEATPAVDPSLACISLVLLASCPAPTAPLDRRIRGRRTLYRRLKAGLGGDMLILGQEIPPV
jgi:hypothetical protein